MNANIIASKNVVLCPCCASVKHVVVRRMLSEDSRIENSCLCDNCGEKFKYFVDKRGQACEK